MKIRNILSTRYISNNFVKNKKISLYMKYKRKIFLLIMQIFVESVKIKRNIYDYLSYIFSNIGRISFLFSL